jgi:hypothetical protein
LKKTISEFEYLNQKYKDGNINKFNQVASGIKCIYSMNANNITQEITSAMTLAFYNLEKNDLIMFGEYIGKIAFTYCHQDSKTSGALGSVFLNIFTLLFGVLILII